jgi:hypothetical protein
MRVAAQMVARVLVVDRTEPRMGLGENASGQRNPRNWYSVLESIAERMTGVPPQTFAWRRLFQDRCFFFSWAPTLGILSASLVRRPTAYLCWGLPQATGSRAALFLRTERLRAILQRVDTLLVNDVITRDEIRRLAGREATVIPLVVDTEYFAFAPAAGRENFVLVPGDNDRDENLVLELARRGISVVRITRSPRIAAIYRDRAGGSNPTVRLCAAFSELRSCYQRAAAVLLPLTSDNHAAGQTALLEAVACGAPVVMSATRTSTILRDFKSILTCRSRRADDWIAKIEEAKHLATSHPEAVRTAAASIHLSHHPAAVAERLLHILSGAAADRRIVASAPH